MLTNGMISYAWRMWVDFIAGIGLPMDDQIAALLALLLVIYGIGRGFKRLVSPEK